MVNNIINTIFMNFMMYGILILFSGIALNLEIYSIYITHLCVSILYLYVFFKLIKQI